jgi:hypothetical protein
MFPKTARTFIHAKTQTNHKQQTTKAIQQKANKRSANACKRITCKTTERTTEWHQSDPDCKIMSLKFHDGEEK